MTFNILYGTARTPAGAWPDRRRLVAEVFGQWEPDVAGLQEAMADQLSDLATDLPEYAIVPGPVSGPNRLRGVAGRVSWHRTLRPALTSARSSLRMRLRRTPQGEVRPEVLSLDPTGAKGRTTPRRITRGDADRGEHCAILYRKDRFRVAASGAFWLSEQPDQPGSLLHGTWQPRVVHWVRLEEIRRRGLLTLYNAHMDYLPWAPLRSGKILRARLDRDWDGTPQFLIGDLNTPTRSAALRDLLKPGPGHPHVPPLRDAWAEAARREGPAQTLHRGTGRGSWPGRIDHILFRAGMTVECISTVTHCAGTYYPSDHFPVVADLREEAARQS